MTGVLLSIKPVYVEAILRGRKRFEFRKSPPKREGIGRAYIYSTAPVKRIVASFTIERIVSGNPKALWRDFKHAAGVDKASFFEYFNCEEHGYAIQIGALEVFETPVATTDFSEDFVPPQSFCYVNGHQQETLERLGGLR